MAQIQVIGCGVIGLTTAIRLLEHGLVVNIITRDLPQHTTSTVAGAIWAGYGLPEKYQQWARTSFDVFQSQADNSDSGVLLTTYREVFRQQETLPWYADVLTECQHIPTDDLPTGYESGYISEVPLIQSPKYMAYLLNHFYELGGTLQQRDVQSLSDLADDHALIINCTGVGAKQVADDDAVHPIWGQVLLVDAPHISDSIMDDEHFTYIFPREDGVILGGIHVHDRWQRKPDDTITKDILARCQQLLPDLRSADIKAIYVGLRPGRDTVRLEAQQLTDTCTIIHNYGHGGIGYTLSWGCAQETLTLVQSVLDA